MLELLCKYRAMQLAVHQFHNLCKNQIFFQDHSFFGDLYGQMEGYYDDLVERVIGLKGAELINLQQIMSKVVADLQSCPNEVKENSEYFKYIQLHLAQILQMIEQLAKADDLSQGTINLIVGQADAIEVLQYKIKQRLGGK
jgi:DNA-binding ferritin-like protein